VDTRESEVKLPVLRCIAKGGEALEIMSSMKVQFVDGPGAEDNVEERAAYKAAYGRSEPAVFGRINEATSNPYMAVVFAAWEHLLLELKEVEAEGPHMTAGGPQLAALQDGACAKMAALGAEWGLELLEFTITGAESTGVADDPAAQLEAYLASRKGNKAAQAADEARKQAKEEAANAEAAATAAVAEVARVAALGEADREKEEDAAAAEAEALVVAHTAGAAEAVAAPAPADATTPPAAAASSDAEVPDGAKSQVATLRTVLKVSEDEELGEGIVAIADLTIALEMVGVSPSDMEGLVTKHRVGDDSVNYVALLAEVEGAP
jgi:hypothetical protein